MSFLSTKPTDTYEEQIQEIKLHAAMCGLTVEVRQCTALVKDPSHREIREESVISLGGYGLCIYPTVDDGKKFWVMYAPRKEAYYFAKIPSHVRVFEKVVSLALQAVIDARMTTAFPDLIRD